jgi:hypothetical protein
MRVKEIKVCSRYGHPKIANKYIADDRSSNSFQFFRVVCNLKEPPDSPLRFPPSYTRIQNFNPDKPPFLPWTLNPFRIHTMQIFVQTRWTFLHITDVLGIPLPLTQSRKLP